MDLINEFAKENYDLMTDHFRSMINIDHPYLSLFMTVIDKPHTQVMKLNRSIGMI